MFSRGGKTDKSLTIGRSRERFITRNSRFWTARCPPRVTTSFAPAKFPRAPKSLSRSCPFPGSCWAWDPDLLRGGGVVVDDLPAVGEFSENQSEAAVRSLAVGHGQAPGAAHEGRFRAQHFDSQLGKVEIAHLVAGARISSLVAVERGLPAAGRFRIGEESEFGRVPVAGHECIEVVAVPGVLLGMENLLDGDFEDVAATERCYPRDDGK